MTRNGRFLLVFADESRQTAERYMVVGGVIISRGYEQTIIDKIGEYRKQAIYPWEFKWHKISKSRLEAYRGFVDLVLSQSEYVHFKSMVIDTSEYDRRTRNKELGFYKLMYQFLLHSFGEYLQPEDRCKIYLDKRTTKYYKLSTLWAILNRGINKRYKIGVNPVRFIEPIDSKDHDLIQLADIVIGAIGYEMNRWNELVDASPAKIALARHISNRVGLASLQRPTPKDKREFSIWHFILRGKGKCPKSYAPERATSQRVAIHMVRFSESVALSEMIIDSPKSGVKKI